jgi:hypothetical protein
MPILGARGRRIPIRLAVEVAGADSAGRAFTESVQTRNVSGGGICFETKKRLLVGDRLLLEIRIPPPLRPRFQGRSSYRVRAVICRVERFTGEAGARIGARFVGEIAG